MHVTPAMYLHNLVFGKSGPYHVFSDIEDMWKKRGYICVSYGTLPARMYLVLCPARLEPPSTLIVSPVI